MRAPHGSGAPMARVMLTAAHHAVLGIGRRCVGEQIYAIQSRFPRLIPAHAPLFPLTPVFNCRTGPPQLLPPHRQTPANTKLQRLHELKYDTKRALPPRLRSLRSRFRLMHRCAYLAKICDDGVSTQPPLTVERNRTYTFAFAFDSFCFAIAASKALLSKKWCLPSFRMIIRTPYASATDNV